MSIIFPIVGCSDIDTKKEIIEKALFNKYGDNFVLDRIGGDLSEFPGNTNKGYAFSTNHPNRLFPVQITKDSDVVIDNYSDILMSLKLEEIVKEMISDVDVIVKSRIQSYWFPPDTSSGDMSPFDYINLSDRIDSFVFFISSQIENKDDLIKEIRKSIKESNDLLNSRIVLDVIFVKNEDKEELIVNIESFTAYADFDRSIRTDNTGIEIIEIKRFETN